MKHALSASVVIASLLAPPGARAITVYSTDFETPLGPNWFAPGASIQPVASCPP
ncbi:MAG TPA: hypothetical protein VNO26_13010 [Candidatus Limnocylindria bacterium]|nr:hypothetical protein [Candidatus Limnocylindria bacterium]